MDDIRVSFLLQNEEPVVRAEVDLLGRIDLCKLLSVRSPGARRSQKNIPGFFWMAQTGEHVKYESRLEMAVLKSVDHERALVGAIAQPLILSFTQDGKKRRHTPDFLFPLKDGGALLVNVTPTRRLTNERNRLNFKLCEVVSDQLGWEYVTRNEPTPTYAANINWLNGYRRPPWLLDRYRDELLKRATDQLTVGEALRDLQPDAFVRPVLFHLMWTREIGFDRNELLSDNTKLQREV
ncbi:TnsA-like heteromeric transposase endonuclease subunit [Variovorax ureilyticus]|uniref:TnsA-like heteromeric transposase endonuclease subunit n=1 Tax=Variovorax ureilyticus TaxID=1836198 RepID=A0ABU8VL95_9BURK